MVISLERNENYIYSEFEKRLKTLSSSFYNGGYGERSGFFIIRVKEDFNEDPYELAKNFEKIKNIQNFVGFLTAVDLIKNSSFYEDENFFIVLTLGLGYICIPGEDCKKSRTINSILVVKKGIEPSCAMDLLNVMISTKVYALMQHGKGVGTSSDAFLLAFEEENGTKYGGFATKIGKSLSIAFLKLMNKSIEKDA
ncbi:MAG: adenosylcobinamide amidohydrolase [Thermoplasmata archaeon]|nr:adenosylcobinamide amidohydrolase [Thermoplasmata archaeon]